MNNNIESQLNKFYNLLPKWWEEDSSDEKNIKKQMYKCIIVPIHTKDNLKLFESKNDGKVQQMIQQIYETNTDIFYYAFDTDNLKKICDIFNVSLQSEDDICIMKNIIYIEIVDIENITKTKIIDPSSPVENHTVQIQKNIDFLTQRLNQYIRGHDIRTFVTKFDEITNFYKTKDFKTGVISIVLCNGKFCSRVYFYQLGYNTDILCMVGIDSSIEWLLFGTYLKKKRGNGKKNSMAYFHLNNLIQYSNFKKIRLIYVPTAVGPMPNILGSFGFIHMPYENLLRDNLDKIEKQIIIRCLGYTIGLMSGLGKDNRLIIPEILNENLKKVSEEYVTFDFSDECKKYERTDNNDPLDIDITYGIDEYNKISLAFPKVTNILISFVISDTIMDKFNSQIYYHLKSMLNKYVDSLKILVESCKFYKSKFGSERYIEIASLCHNVSVFISEHFTLRTIDNFLKKYNMEIENIYYPLIKSTMNKIEEEKKISYTLYLKNIQVDDIIKDANYENILNKFIKYALDDNKDVTFRLKQALDEYTNDKEPESIKDDAIFENVKNLLESWSKVFDDDRNIIPSSSKRYKTH
jgi:hypothetical protein